MIVSQPSAADDVGGPPSGEVVQVFDTTLGDGGQAPGATLQLGDKLAIAHQLARLQVDAMEAGFPACSPDDFEAVQRVAREVAVPLELIGIEVPERQMPQGWSRFLEVADSTKEVEDGALLRIVGEFGADRPAIATVAS